jgi:cbb3-type cytochrome oxidase subunit 3
MLYKFYEIRACLFQDCDIDPLQRAFRVQSTSGILFLINVILLIVFKYAFSFYIYFKSKRENFNRITPSDFSLMIKLPKGTVTSRQDLNSQVETFLNLGQ